LAVPSHHGEGSDSSLSHAGVPFGPPPPAAAIPPAAASSEDDGPVPPDQPSITLPPPSTRGPSASMPVPPPSTRGPSARALTRQAVEASQQPMLQQQAREAAGYAPPQTLVAKMKSHTKSQLKWKRENTRWGNRDRRYSISMMQFPFPLFILC
jgi:hypothetical protein